MWKLGAIIFSAVILTMWIVGSITGNDADKPKDAHVTSYGFEVGQGFDHDIRIVDGNALDLHVMQSNGFPVYVRYQTGYIGNITSFCVTDYDGAELTEADFDSTDWKLCDDSYNHAVEHHEIRYSEDSVLQLAVLRIPVSLYNQFLDNGYISTVPSDSVTR